ncbi:MAG: hypothetical protein Q8O24_06090 [Gallionellaceae bacterium]|nr:hypothetical protein [Gallionellaceae bacterium]
MSGDFPTTEQWLIEGSDARIALNPVTGKNKYGCAPQPNKKIAAFGSATASTISETAFLAADQLRNRLVHLLTLDSAEAIYADEMHRVGKELIEVCELSHLHELDIIFAASGTDCHSIAAQLAIASQAQTVRMLMVDETETGSGVPNALAGERVAIPLRLVDGTPRAIADIDADFEQQVAAAVAAEQRVLLTMVDVSKTGLIAPSVACAVSLSQRFPEVLEVLVDACQFRIAPSTLAAYLVHGFMVAMTGSKFMGGPSFSGALMIPAVLAKKYRTRALSQGFLTFSNQAEWLVNWSEARQLSNAANFGLLLRWQAALKEMREFHSVSNTVARHFLFAIAEAVTQRLVNDPHLELLAVPTLQREPFVDDLSWDNVQTIFPFVLRHAEKTFFSRDETLQVYRILQNEGVQLAQPVDCGEREGVAVSALRLCVSSRLVVEAMQGNGKNEQAVIQRALEALNQVVRVAQKP